MKEKMKRVVITGIHERDAFYVDRDDYIGLTGEFEQEANFANIPGYFAGDFTPDGEDRLIIFFAVGYHELSINFKKSQ